MNTLKNIFLKSARAGLTASALIAPLAAMAEEPSASLQTIYNEKGIDAAAIADLKACTHITPDQQALDTLHTAPAYSGDALLSTLPGKRPYTLYGDLNHSDLRGHAFFFSDKNIDDMIHAGIKHVFLERPADQQKTYDDIASGILDENMATLFLKLSVNNAYLKPDQLDPYYHAEARGVMRLGAAGIKIHAVDQRFDGNTLGTPAERALVNHFFDDMQDFRRDHCPDIAAMNLKVYWGAYYLNYLANADKAGHLPESVTAFDKFFDAAEDDRTLARKIESMANGEPSAIFYGAQHGLKNNDLNDLLGRDKCASIVLISDEIQYADKWLTAQHLRHAPDAPEFYYFTSNDKAYAGRTLPDNLKPPAP